MGNEMKPCPFCGTTTNSMPESHGRMQQLLCMTCGACGPEVDRFEPYAAAVAAWNRRPAPSTSKEAATDPLAELRRLIADDAYAMTFQTFGQYRTALLKAADKLAASVGTQSNGGGEVDSNGLPDDPNWRAADLRALDSHGGVALPDGAQR